MAVNTSDCIQEFGRILLIRCGGPLDGMHGSSAVPVGDILKRARRCGARIVLLDLSHSPYADSGGLRWLLDLQRHAEAERLELRVVCAAGGKVRRNLVLLRTGLHLYDGVHSAWAAPLSGSRFGTAPAGAVAPGGAPPSFTYSH